jgi:redox-sensitive bicupin YhaK (pirin superfamily)
MLVLRRRETLFQLDRGWFRVRRHLDLDLDAAGDLRVLNEVYLAGNEAWRYHAGPGIEEITYVSSGRLHYSDGLGETGFLGPGTVQRVTFGPSQSYVTTNADVTASVTFVQLWVVAAGPEPLPSTEQQTFRVDERFGRLLPIVVPVAGFGAAAAPTSKNAIGIHQDLTCYSAVLSPADAVSHQFRRGFDGYLVLVHGDAHVATDEDAVEVDAGGAVEVYDEPQLDIRARTQGAEALLIEFRSTPGRHPTAQGT